MTDEQSTFDPTARKTVLRQFTYGLYAVAALHDGERGIFTANWLSQVSFDPPLVVVSIERASSTLPLIEASRRFAVAPLTAGDRELAGALGKPKVRAGDKYATLDLDVRPTKSGILIPTVALGYVECNVQSITDAGDSVLVLGEVIEAVSFSDGDPLTMRDAGFRHAG